MKTRKLLALVALLTGPFVLNGQVPLGTSPTLALGQPPEIAATDLRSNGPNVVDARSLDSPYAVAVDPLSGAVYVADTSGHRVLGWRNGISFANGAPADIIIGQRDALSDLERGPGLEAGLSGPTGLAVNPANGDLFVVDAGNHRVVKYRRPTSQSGSGLRFIDQVIGQPNKNTRAAGLGPSQLSLQAGRASGIAFDAQNNVLVADRGNHRVLRFAAAAIGDAAPDGPDANEVLGQPDFYTNQAARNQNTTDRENPAIMREPSGLAVDSAGFLYVADALNRVLVYRNVARNLPAERIMGIDKNIGPGDPFITPQTLGMVPIGAWATSLGVFTIGNKPFVVDPAANRITRYKPVAEWPAPATQLSPSAEAVIGQPTLFQTPAVIPTDLVNRGGAVSGVDTLSAPIAGAFGNGKVYVADSGNNRVMRFPDLSTGPESSPGAGAGPYAAEAILGQLDPAFNSRNLVEGKEFSFVGGFAGIAFDTSSDPPRLYVADSANNRVLGFEDARTVRGGGLPKVVIGQSDLYRTNVNWPGGRGTTLSRTGLNGPSGVIVDNEGNVYVADTGNGRVVRFPKPFEQPANDQGIIALIEADLVLGQPDFATKRTIVNPDTMGVPVGLAFLQPAEAGGAPRGILVSDGGWNRVLLFLPPGGVDYQNGQAADKVFGQNTFIASDASSDQNRLNLPLYIATDTDDRLYVCDTGNDRVQIFPRVTTAPDMGAQPAIPALTGFRNPQGITVSRVTGEVWVADSQGRSATPYRNATLVRYPKYDTLSITRAPDVGNALPPNSSGLSSAPVNLALDGFGDLWVADNISRILVYFPSFELTNAADYSQSFAPGMWTSMWLPTGLLNVDYTVATSPLPTRLAGLEIRIGNFTGTPSPIWFATSTQINFILPNSTPSSGSVDIFLVQPLAGGSERIVAAARDMTTDPSGSVPMQRASPAFFTLSQTGSGQIAAVNNKDGTVNGQAHPALVNDYVQLYATGAGFLPNAPADGQPAPLDSLVYTPNLPRINFQGLYLGEVPPSEPAQFSGLAPGLIGVWQINIKIPDWAIPGENFVIIFYGEYNSGKATTVYVQR